MAPPAAVLSHIYTISTLFLTLLCLQLLITFRTLFKYLSLQSSPTSSSSNNNNLIQLIEDKVPSTMFKIKSLALESVPECAVCLCKFEDGDKIRKLKCKHSFHKDCVDRWLEMEFGSATCPLCRREVLSRDVALRVRVGLVEDSQYDESDEELIFLLSALQGSNLTTLF